VHWERTQNALGPAWRLWAALRGTFRSVESRTYDLGPRPRPVVIRIVREDGSISAPYLFYGEKLATPPEAMAIEIWQMPIYDIDYPAADDPGWGNKTGAGVTWPAPGAGVVTRVEVRDLRPSRHAAGQR
jgi:hypothetical protein